MRLSIIFSFVLLFFLAQKSIANVVGSDLQTFNPTTSGIDCVSVQPSETLMPGVFNFGLFVNYSENSIPYYYEANDGTQTRIKDTMFGADINFGLGLAKNWDAGMSFPRVMKQTVESEDASYSYEGSGNSEVRINSKYRFHNGKNLGMAVLATVNMSLIVNNPYIGYNATPTYNLEFIMDTKLNNWALLSNFGYRFRNPGSPIENSPVKPLDDQLIASLGASYLVKSIDTKFIFETFGSLPAKKIEEGYNRAGEALEVLLGIKFDITNNFAFHMGGGKRIISGNSSPAWRAYTGINLAIGPTFSKPPKIRRKVRKPRKKEMLLKDIDPFANPPEEPEETFIARDALFGFDSYKINKEAMHLLDKLVKYITQKPGYQKLYIEGHTDSVGSEYYNKELSNWRAQNVKEYLIKKYKLKPNTLEAIGYGESKPVASNGNYQGRELNRRVEFRVVWKAKHKKVKKIKKDKKKLKNRKKLPDEI